MKRILNWKFVLTGLLIISTIVIAFSNMPSTNPVLGWYGDDISGTENYEIELMTEEGGIYRQALDEKKGYATVYIPEEYMNVKSIKVTGSNIEALTRARFVLTSRDLVIFKDNTGLYVDDANSAIMTDRQLKMVQFLLGFDWRVKTEILAVIWFIYILFMVVGKLKEKKRLNIRTVGTIVLTMMLFVALNFVFSGEKSYKLEELHLHYGTQSDIINIDTDLVQRIETQRDIRGIQLRLSNGGTALKENYVINLYDANMNILEGAPISGSAVIDNQYYLVLFSKMYPKGEYYFGIVSPEYTEDTLTVWQTASDEYEAGELYIGGVDTGVDLDFNLVVEGPKLKLIGTVIIGVFYLLVMMIIWWSDGKKLAKITIGLTYFITLVYAVFMMLFIWKYLHLGAYDEMAHISYLADLSQNHQIVPDYEKQMLLVNAGDPISETEANTVPLRQSFGTFVGQWSNTVNYLGHPSLYYWLMLPLRAVTFEGNLVCVDLDVLRAFNAGLAIFAILLYLYIGYSRIRKNYPALHFLYATMIVAFPMLTGIAPTINNDNLAILIAAIFTLGIIRFAEGKRNKLTYCLIAIGITGSALTKLTLCSMLVLCAGIFVIKTLITEKKFFEVFNKDFLISVPIYIIGVLYYVLVVAKYGTVQISLHDVVSNEIFKTYSIVYKEPIMRTRMTFFKFIQEFMNNFMDQWTAGGTWNLYAGEHNALNRIAYKMLWIVPIVMLARMKYKDDETCIRSFFKGLSAALMITVLMQFIRAFNDFQFISGHPGTQSRYYICVMPVMVLMACYEFQSGMKENRYITLSDRKENKFYLNSLYNVGSVVWALLALYGGGLFYILFTSNFIK